MKKLAVQMLIITLLLCGGPAILTGVARAENQRYDLDLPAGLLAASLDSLSRQADLELKFDRRLLEGKKTEGLAGRFTAREALDELLDGSGVGYRFVAEKTVALEPVPGRASGEAVTLPDTTITAQRERGYAVRSAPTATKTDVPIFDTPVSVQVISKELIQDQQATSAEEALKNVSGVFNNNGADWLYDQVYLRGFKTDSRHYIDGLRTQAYSHSLANIERIEVLKGPAAMLYGRVAEPGGLINFVTKRPQETPYYSFQQQFGSEDHYRTLMDVTGPITEDGSLLYRLNAEYRDSGSFQDHVGLERKFFAPSLTWKISPATQLDVDFRYNEMQGQKPGGIPAVGNEPADIPISTFLGEPSDELDFQLFTGGLTFSHEFSNQWKLLAKFAINHSRDDFDTTNLSSLNEQTGIATRTHYHVEAYEDRSYVGDINLTGKIATWGLEHTLLAGFDSHYSEDGDAPVYTTVSDIDIYDPEYDSTGFRSWESPWYREVEWYGIYLQDQVKLFDQWHLLLGGRYDFAREASGDYADDATEHSDEEFSPRVGLMYHPVPWLGIYANYVHGFNKSNFARLEPGSDAEPERSDEYEIGVKGQWFDERLIASLVFYHLTKENVSQPSSDPTLAALGYYELAGEARSQGIEFDISGQLTEWLQVIGTYSYTDAEITENNTGNEGNRLMCVPRHAGSLWTHVDFSELGCPGLTAGAGVFVQGERQGDNANSFQLPEFVRCDASLGYKWHFGDTAVTAQLNVENLFDEEYYAASLSRLYISAGQPRTLYGSIRLEF